MSKMLCGDKANHGAQDEHQTGVEIVQGTRSPAKNARKRLARVSAFHDQESLRLESPLDAILGALAGRLPIFTSKVDSVDPCRCRILCRGGVSEKVGHDDRSGSPLRL